MTLTTRVSRCTSRLYQLLLLLNGYIDDDDDDNVDDEVCTLLVLLNPSQLTSDADLLCQGNLSLSLSLSLSLCVCVCVCVCVSLYIRYSSQSVMLVFTQSPNASSYRRHTDSGARLCGVSAWRNNARFPRLRVA